MPQFSPAAQRLLIGFVSEPGQEGGRCPACSTLCAVRCFPLAARPLTHEEVPLPPLLQVGIGNMGAAMATRLLGAGECSTRHRGPLESKRPVPFGALLHLTAPPLPVLPSTGGPAGYRLVVCDKNEEAVQRLAAAGAKVAQTPAALASTPGNGRPGRTFPCRSCPDAMPKDCSADGLAAALRAKPPLPDCAHPRRPRRPVGAGLHAALQRARALRLPGQRGHPAGGAGAAAPPPAGGLLDHRPHHFTRGEVGGCWLFVCVLCARVDNRESGAAALPG